MHYMMIFSPAQYLLALPLVEVNPAPRQPSRVRPSSQPTVPALYLDTRRGLL
jgi:hypothetical protein